MRSNAAVLQILKDLYAVSGFRLSLHDTQFREVLAYPRELSPFCRCLQKSSDAHAVCIRTDREAFGRAAKEGGRQMYRCAFGLTEVISPLYHYGTLAGYLMMGQIPVCDDGSREELLAAAGSYAPKEELLAALREMPLCTEEKVLHFANIMTVCAEYLTLAGVVKPSGDLGERIEAYLRSHLAEPITLATLAAHFGCSRSTLISAFAKTHSQTISASLQELRLAAAERMLRDTALSTGEIARRCGFADGGYMTKVFRRERKTTPGSYRRE